MRLASGWRGGMACLLVVGLAAVMPRSIASAASEPPSGPANQRTIKGRVTDERGNPIAGALVQWGYIRDPLKEWDETTTDDDGRYRLQISQFGIDYRLGVSAAGLAPGWIIPCRSWVGRMHDLPTDQDVPPPETANFQLEPEHHISGVVLDEQGQPITGVTVEAKTASTNHWSSFFSPTPAMPIPGAGPVTTQTGADGRFALDGLPDEKVDLLLRAPHRHVNDRNYPVDRESQIVMSGSGRPGVVRFQVVDRASKAPVTDFIVTRRYDATPQAIHAEDGRVELSEHFTAGCDYTLYIDHEQHAPAQAELRAGPLDSQAEAVIQLEPGQPFRGRLIDAASGEPLGAVAILYGIAGDEGSHHLDWAGLDQYTDGYHSLSGVQRAVSDEQGDFWLSEAPGRQTGTLIILATGYERLILKSADRPVANADGRTQIKLGREASIAGRLVRDGKPQAGLEVTVWRQQKPDIFDQNFEKVLTDADGNFRIGSLAAGDYSLSYWTHPSRAISISNSLAKLTLAAGEQKDLGTLTIGEPQR